MNATAARAATKVQITKIAKEFITNNTGIPIQDAINDGYFSTTVSFDGVPNPEKIGIEVVKQLELQGYEAQHVYDPTYNENYIVISWEGD